MVEGQLPVDEVTELTDWVAKDESQHRMVVVPASHANAQQARLKLVCTEVRGQRSLVSIELLTGRKHQIRLQLSSRGHPIIGDRKYEARSGFPQGIALHSRRLTLKHPTKDEVLTFDAPPPDYWP